MSWIKKFLRTIGDMLTSKKFLAAAGTVVAQALASGNVKTGILAAGSAYVLGQGMADIGKEAKKPPSA